MNTLHTHNAFRKYLFAFAISLASFPIYAQQFSVQRFRLLPNDISAYIQPVKDLNDEACALIKVVGNRDFVFSTPLGIVKRTNDVGETWIYVPNGTIQLTIKHPQWGVLRDYRLPSPLESRLTYELILNSPITMPRRKIPPMKEEIAKYELTFEIPSRLPETKWKRPKRPKEQLSYLIMLDAAIHNKDVAGGIRAGVMRRHGAYIHLLSDFNSTPDTHGMECDKNGMPKGSDIPPYYTGKTKKSHYVFMTGGLHRIVGDFCIYEGVGYGARTVVWETNEGQYLRNKSYSAKGFSAELGGILRVGKFAFSAGAITTAGKYWELNVGIGIRL